MALTPAEAFGKAVRQLRVQRAISQEAAALASDIDRAYFGHIERGTKSPTLKTVWKVAEALEVRPSELLDRTERILRD
jgi:transcriptional regulator with XRE-family HTH domain